MSKRESKAIYFQKLNDYLNTYQSIFIVNVDNVSSNQMHQIRQSLRGEATVLMGKNTMVRRALKGLISSRPEFEKLLAHVKGNIGFVFTNGDLKDIPLGIPTKIARGTIEIVSDVPLVTAGEKVGPSEAALLNMLNISPFTYGMSVVQVYDHGAIFSPAVLDVEESQLVANLMAAIREVASISLAVGYPTVASVPHSIIN
ncbi:ribosomal protein P0 (A0) (L10E), partial [Rhizopus azygosporus]